MKLSEILEEQLKKEPKFITDNGELKKWVVIDKARNFDDDVGHNFFVRVKNRTTLQR
jgi:adenine-specific DNA-methyltransferase